MEGEEIVLLDYWSSPYATRVKIALKEKGIEYVCKEQDLVNKGSLLIEMNPIHTKMKFGLTYLLYFLWILT
ncbi:Glutathione S-transferase U28 [Bienertia sinuspersici]